MSIRWTSAAFKIVGAQLSEEQPFCTDAAAGAGGSAIPMSTLLDGFIKPETLDESESWYCGKCKEHRRATKVLHPYAAPRVLVLHLKRFAFHNGRREKIPTPVEVPLEGLDLSKWVQVRGSPDMDPDVNRNKAPPPVYNLFAVANHYGTSGGGHYVATARNPVTGHWYELDDDVVTRMDAAEPVDGSHAYVLFYELQGAD